MSKLIDVVATFILFLHVSLVASFVVNGVPIEIDLWRVWTAIVFGLLAVAWIGTRALIRENKE